MKPRLLLRVGVTALRRIDHTSPALVPDQIMHASLHAWSIDVDAAAGRYTAGAHAFCHGPIDIGPWLYACAPAT